MKTLKNQKMDQYCKNKCDNKISSGSKSGLCRRCSCKLHSHIIKKMWTEGRYDNRNESYRKNKEYKNKVSRQVKKLWNDGVYTKERNKKISNALKGRVPKNKGNKRDYIHICKICGEEFITKTQHRSICDKGYCQSNKARIRKISPKTELNRRRKISKSLKGKIPKNLKQNIKSNNSFRQKEMFEMIKKYFIDAKFNYYVKTQRSFRFLDTAVPSLMLDFEYDGKIHLMKSVKKNDVFRKKELLELGWKRITINRKNFHNLDKICKHLKKKRMFNGDN